MIGRKRKSSHEGLLVEMLGLPASGKSTLSSRVRDILSQRWVPANYPPYGLSWGAGNISLRVLEGHCR